MKITRTFFTLMAGLAALLFTGYSLPSYAQSAPPAPASASTAAAPTAVQTENEPGFTVVGLSVRTSRDKEANGSGQIPQLWQQAMQDGSLQSIPNRADGETIALYTDYSGPDNDEYTYVLGVKVTAADKIPDGMVAVKVPAGKYAVVASETGSLPQVIPQLWQRVHAMDAKELGGERAFKTDVQTFPADFDWQDTHTTLYLGLK